MISIDPKQVTPGDMVWKLDLKRGVYIRGIIIQIEYDKVYDQVNTYVSWFSNGAQWMCSNRLFIKEEKDYTGIFNFVD